MDILRHILGDDGCTGFIVNAGIGISATFATWGAIGLSSYAAMTTAYVRFRKPEVYRKVGPKLFLLQCRRNVTLTRFPLFILPGYVISYGLIRQFLLRMKYVD